MFFNFKESAMTQRVILVLVLVAVGISEISSEEERSATEMVSDRGQVLHMSFRCPAVYGRYPVPGNCEYFFECRYGYPTLMHCNWGYLYDKEKQQCIDRRKVKCDAGTGGNQFRCPYPSGQFPDPHNCSRFYVCQGSVFTQYQCPQFHLYDETTHRCIGQQYVNCGRRPGGVNTGNQFRCPYPRGQFPDPHNCSRFYVCQGSVFTQYQCPQFHLYDETTHRCIRQQYVNCGQRPGGVTTELQKSTTFTLPSTTISARLSTTRAPTTTTTPTTITTPTTTTASPTPTTTTTTPIPTTTTTTTSPIPTTTTTTPVPTTTTTTPAPTTTTTTASTPAPTTTTTTASTPVPTTTTTTTPVPTTTTTTPVPTRPTVTKKPSTEFPVPKPNTPPPTDCVEDDLDCIIDGTGDVTVWFDCPKRYGHLPHGSSKQLFIHCDNWRPLVKKCAKQTTFSPEYLVCVWTDKKKGI